ncbi:MAG: hypothetical protein VYD20_04135 [Candidatus Neomarinimicrobiota bacterium]|nr:hypothetical protein [Candidatus Neomarinimicrobiota bacterium]
MHLIFRHVLLLITLINFSYSLGTQFLSVPSSAIELAFGPSPLFGSLSINNPALLIAPNKGASMNISYGTWFNNISNSSFSLASKLGRGNIGLNIRHMGISDLELRSNRPTDDPLATFSSTSFAVASSYSQSYGSLKVGATLQYLLIQLYTENVSGATFDVGITRSFGKNIDLGFSILNSGYINKTDSYNPSLPLRFLSALSYKLPTSKWDHKISLSAEKSSFVDGSIIRVASETKFEKFDLRFGTQSSKEVTVVSGGFGVRLGLLNFHYGIQIGSQHLGLPQMLDISIKLP